MGAASQHHVGGAPADEVRRLADRLGTGGARGLAGRIRPAGSEDGRQMTGGRSRLLVGLANRVQCLQPEAREPGRIDASLPARAMNQVGESTEVLLTLPRAQVDAEPGLIQPGHFEARLLHGQRRGRQSELSRSTMLRPAVSVRAVVCQLEVSDLGRDPRGKRGGVEERDRADAAPAFAQLSPGRFRITPYRRDHADARHDDSSLHRSSPRRPRSESGRRMA